MIKIINLRKIAASITAASLILSSLGSSIYANESILYSKSISKGISFDQKQVTFGDTSTRINVLTSDLNDPDVGMIFSKAVDKVKKHDTLSNQITREIQKGNNVVAGINADMFNVINGYSSGPQIINGAIITGHNNMREQDLYPVFGIDKEKKPFVDYIHFSGKLNVLDYNNQTTGQEIAIDNVNRENYSNSLIINTTDLNDTKMIDFSSYASNGTLIVVKGVSSQLALGKDFYGEIDSINTGVSELKIPNDGIVLAAHGEKSAWVNNNLKKGSKIRINLDYDKNIQDAIGVYTHIVKDSYVLSNTEIIAKGTNSTIVTSRRARTAIGITSDNKVISVVSDVGKTSTGSNSGLTLEEMGYYMQSLGVVNAVALDGGGSSQMNVRLFGNNSVQIVNNPSDGSERRLTNAILFSSKAPRANDVASISPVNKNIVLFKNSHYKVNLRGVDSNNNTVDLSNVDLTWKTTGSIGTVTENGVLIASSIPSTGSLAAFYNNVYGGSNVKVVDKLKSLNISEGSKITLKSGERKQFSLAGKSDNNENVYISNHIANWAFDGDIGSVDSNGFFNSNGKSGTGMLSVFVDDQVSHISVTVLPSNGDQKDTTAPEFTEIDPVKTIYSLNGIFNMIVGVNEAGTGVDASTLKVKIDGSDIEGYYDNDASALFIKGNNLSEGIHNIEISLSDKAGNNVIYSSIFTLLNKDQDSTGPNINIKSPINGETINVQNPRIFVDINDDLSGVNSSDVKIVLDGRELKSYYNQSWTGAYAIVDSLYSQGEHTIEATVRDKSGNVSKTQSKFIYTPFKGPTNQSDFSISFTSDILGSAAAYDIADSISKDSSSLVVVNGVKDSASSKEWKNLYTNYGIKNKDIAIGSGENDFSLPVSTYSFEYGNSLLISLDSSKGGIAKTDISQFDYLSRILEKNSNNNVFIFTHYLTKDVFNTKDSMSVSDALKFEEMLSSYKKAYPNKNINVIFGHAQGIKSWESDGVNYISSGSSSLKGSVKVSDGGFLSYTKFDVSGNNITKEFIPVVDKVYITDESTSLSNVELVKGSRRPLILSGSFSPSLTRFLVPLNKFDNVKINWISSNSNVVSVDSNGTITANSSGKATITGQAAGKLCSINVTVIDQKDVTPGKIQSALSKFELNSGESQKLDVVSYSLYGENYKIDNDLITWSFDETIGIIKDGIFTAAQDIANNIVSEIKATYNGKVTNILVTIKKILK